MGHEALQDLLCPRDAWLQVSSIAFTHDSVSSYFAHGSHAGTPLMNLVHDLEDGTLTLSDAAMRIDVVKYHGQYRSLHNRRLWCFKEYQGLNPSIQVKIHVRIVPLLGGGEYFEGRSVLDKFLSSNTTSNDGSSVRLRSRSGSPTRRDSRWRSESPARKDCHKPCLP